MSQASYPSVAGIGDTRTSVFLVPFPQIIFLYPSLLMSIIAGIYMAFFPNPQAGHAFVISAVFLSVLALNLMVFAFDFPRTTSLTLAAFVVSIILAISLIFKFSDILPFVKQYLALYHPMANATFYFTFASILGLIFVGVFFKVRFDYWEVTSNELLHHHGFLSNLERFTSSQLKVDKEINDVFEYLLLRSGRLILHPAGERRAIVLENVFFINRKEDELTRLLSAMKVKVETDNS